MCVSPVILKKPRRVFNSEYLTNKVPCGKCFECRSRRRSDWAFRLNQELKHADNASFITLTYDDECLTFSNNNLPNLDYRDLQCAFKRYRRRFSRLHNRKSKIKYFAVGEYGSQTSRPHYHVILFNVDVDLFCSVWKYGNTHVGDVTPASINYTLKYCLKTVFDPLDGDDRAPEKALMSKGLGMSFITNNMYKFVNSFPDKVINANGMVVALPRYYREKMFTDEAKVKFKISMAKTEEKQLDRRENPLFKDRIDDKNRKLKNLLTKTN